MTATLSITEDQMFDAVWGFVSGLITGANVLKGFQNMTSTPLGSYIVVQPGIKQRANQGVRTYDPVALLQQVERDSIYAYQVDCYGPAGPDQADIVSIAWRSLWACDYFAGNLVTPTPGAPLPVTPLYADEPVQLNIVNGELAYEQRFMLKLYLQANTVVSLPQDFYTGPIPVVTGPPVDDWPV